MLNYVQDKVIVRVLYEISGAGVKLIVLANRMSFEQKNKSFHRPLKIDEGVPTIIIVSFDDSLPGYVETLPVRTGLFVLVDNPLALFGVHSASDCYIDHRFFGSQMDLVGEVIDQMHKEGHRAPEL